MTQETFVRATIFLHKYEGEEARAWLFKVSRNAYLDEWRKQQRRQTLPFLPTRSTKQDMNNPYGLPEESMLTKELVQELKDLLAFLPENYLPLFKRI